MCQCLKGFVSKDKVEWNNGNWSRGCVRRTPLECRSDGFIKPEKMKVPDHAELALGYDGDQRGGACSSNCSCVAYSYYSVISCFFFWVVTGIGCMLWSRSLIDAVKLSSGGADLYLRLSESELGNGTKVKVIRIITGAVGAATVTIIAVFVLVIQKRRAQRRERSKTLTEILEGNLSLDKFEELPFFKFGKLAAATDNFKESNKLGQGGFGPVYKGTLETGEELAIKRLSRTSTQGVKEFMNEVLVISKLQHRNLVKLLGCCVERQERMLIYEYLPNRSLDAFLFDPQKKGILDWNKRYNIIEGISRGLLYLHRDARLKIIHRDLKAANILLDENLNPKISDFGMARIFGGNQSQADTTRVVGTYGYMSPEYAIEGRFSEKSDVFSFGVLLLEIITGKKTQWYDEESLSLLGYERVMPFGF